MLCIFLDSPKRMAHTSPEVQKILVPFHYSPMWQPLRSSTTGMTLGRWRIARRLVVVLLNSSLAQTAKERIQVWQGGVKFNVIRFEQRRNRPVSISFRMDNEKSTYRFNTAGIVADIAVGDLRYEVGSTSPRDVVLSNNQSLGWTRRGLAGGSGANEKQYGEMFVAEHRRLYACSDCERDWGMLCGRGLGSVCDLVDYGPPFEASAEASIFTLCDDFGHACLRITANLACQGQCGIEEKNGQWTDFESKQGTSRRWLKI